jgi:hypothetical protein
VVRDARGDTDCKEKSKFSFVELFLCKLVNIHTSRSGSDPLWAWSVAPMLASPGFNPQYHQKRKIKRSFIFIPVLETRR